MPMLHCEIVTPERKLYSDDVKFVVLPAANGEMGVYANHEPVVSLVNSGYVRVTEEEGGEPIRYFVSGGYAQIDAGQVIILAEHAIPTVEIDRNEVGVRIDDLKEELATLKDDDPKADWFKSEIEWNETLLKFDESRK